MHLRSSAPIALSWSRAYLVMVGGIWPRRRPVGKTSDPADSAIPARKTSIAVRQAPVHWGSSVGQKWPLE